MDDGKNVVIIVGARRRVVHGVLVDGVTEDETGVDQAGDGGVAGFMVVGAFDEGDRVPVRYLDGRLKVKAQHSSRKNGNFLVHRRTAAAMTTMMMLERDAGVVAGDNTQAVLLRTPTDIRASSGSCCSQPR